MVTLIVLLSFSAFFLFYNTSKRAKLHRGLRIEKWAQDHSKKTLYSGFFLSFLAALLSGFWFSWGGVFVFLVVFMTVGSAIVLLAPLRTPNYKLLMAAFAGSFFVELILF